MTGQTFTFECACEHVTGSRCDICNSSILGRSFHGLLIKRNGQPYKWIDEPYTVRRLTGDVIQFIEQLPNPDQVNIARWQTPFATMQQFIDSTTCFCGMGGAMAMQVDTPLIGTGTPGDPITIGQFGADTTMVLRWDGAKWFPSKIPATAILGNLPYYLNDGAALAGGLAVGDSYLLECGNTYGMPSGMYKVVKVCGFDCSYELYFYVNDAGAIAGGVLVGREYVLAVGNTHGVLHGFVKVVTEGLVKDGTIDCAPVLTQWANDLAAIGGGLALGDHYTVTSSNTYAAPAGVERVVSDGLITAADSDACCELGNELPFFNNDGAAIAGGLAVGDFYYLGSANTYGWFYGSRKKVN